MKLRWEDEVAPWEPPTNLTAPGALFNARPARADWWQLYGEITLLYSQSAISLGTAMKLFTQPRSGV